MEWKFRLIGLFAIALILGGPAIYLWMRKAAPQALRDIYDEANHRETKSLHRVQIRFHTYWGFLAFVAQQQHRAELPADTAEFLLARLHAFNLQWGFFAAGAAFIPILSWFNYRAQLKQIRRAVQSQQIPQDSDVK